MLRRKMFVLSFGVFICLAGFLLAQGTQTDLVCKLLTHGNVCQSIGNTECTMGYKSCQTCDSVIELSAFTCVRLEGGSCDWRKKKAYCGPWKVGVCRQTDGSCQPRQTLGACDNIFDDCTNPVW